MLFYIAPEPLPVTKPGQIIWSQLISLPEAGINAWRVLYSTTGVNGKVVATSATIFAPADKDTHDVIVWGHGTKGIADQCAPSRADDPTPNIAYFSQYISQGYAVVAPDYEGLGTPGTHPYLVGASEGYSVLDAARMAKKFSPVHPGKGTVLVGHSQGGQAVLFAGQFARSYAPDLTIDGVAALAPVGNLSEIFEADIKNPTTIGLVAMAAAGFKTAYPELDLTQTLSASFIKKLPIVESSCLVSIVLSFASEVGTAIVSDPTTTPPWPDLLTLNSPGAVKVDAPVLIAHGQADTTVPASISTDMLDSYCALDTHVQRKLYRGENATHDSVVALAQKDILSFVKDRFSHKKFVDGCP